MTTLDLTTTDDAHEDHTGANYSASATAVNCGAHTSGVANRQYRGGFFFALTAEIPDGSTIDACYLTVQPASTVVDDPNVNIAFENTADADDFTTNADVTSRTRVSTSVQWTATGVGTSALNSPSLITALQALVDGQSGLANGAGVVAFMDGRNDAIGGFQVISIEGTGAEAVLHIEFTAPAGGTDALTANDLTTGAPTLTAAAIGQIHVLSGTDLATGAPALDTPALGQIHALTGNDLTTGAPTLSTPALGQIHALTGNDLTVGTPALSTPAIGQIHALTGSDIVTGTPFFSAATLGQIHGLTALDLVAGTPTLSMPVLVGDAGSIVTAVYTASLFANITPTATAKANPTPTASPQSNPTPAQEVYSG